MAMLADRNKMAMLWTWVYESIHHVQSLALIGNNLISQNSIHGMSLKLKDWKEKSWFQLHLCRSIFEIQLKAPSPSFMLEDLKSSHRAKMQALCLVGDSRAHPRILAVKGSSQPCVPYVPKSSRRPYICAPIAPFSSLVKIWLHKKVRINDSIENWWEMNLVAAATGQEVGASYIRREKHSSKNQWNFPNFAYFGGVWSTCNNGIELDSN